MGGLLEVDSKREKSAPQRQMLPVACQSKSDHKVNCSGSADLDCMWVIVMHLTCICCDTLNSYIQNHTHLVAPTFFTALI